MAEVKLDIDYVADLARLELTPEQKEAFGADLGNIVPDSTMPAASCGANCRR